MGAMSIREFNANISKALSAAENGEDIVLTRHGKQVLRVTREGLASKSSMQPDRAILRLRELLEKGIGFGGPATYEERTGR